MEPNGRKTDLEHVAVRWRAE